MCKIEQCWFVSNDSTDIKFATNPKHGVVHSTVVFVRNGRVFISKTCGWSLVINSAFLLAETGNSTSFETVSLKW